MNNEIKIVELSNKLEELISKTYHILDEANSIELKERLKNEIKELNNRVDLKVAFVGQYGSGKSTIISAITGNKDIKIDANVATDEVSEYRWNNIILMDTPGILAGKVEHHDQRTKDALKNSDLIVYVLTSQLFDDVIFENFIDLAYNQALKDKMLIAVNKMSMEKGDFDELEANYRESIKNIFSERGYDFDFEVIFIDAADYIEGIEDNDPDFVQLSNFHYFISSLNEFVIQKGLVKKQFDTPIRLLKSSLADIALSNFDPNLQILLEQAIKKIKGSRRNIERSIGLEISKFEQEIQNKGYSLTHLIGESDENTFKNEEDNYQRFIDKKIEEVSENIQQFIQQEEEELINELDNFESKDSVVAYKKSIDIKLNTPNLSTTQRNSLEKQKKIISFLGKSSEKIVEQTLRDSTLNGLKGVSGSNMHKMVYDVGKFFGHKFKPWGAVKMAGNIGKFAKYGGAALSVIGIGLDIWNYHKEEKQNKQIQAIKNQYNDSIRNYAGQIVNSLKTAFNEYLQHSFDSKISELDNQKIEIIQLENDNSKLSEAVRKLESEYVDFIEVIEKN